MKKILAFLMTVLIFAGLLPANASAVSAKAFAVINGDTGKLLYSGCADTKLPMASTTKIMTALLLLKAGNLSKQITVTSEMIAVEGSSMGLQSGDTLTRKDLLYGMMLPSGNDAANVIAYSVAGGIKQFVELMNREALKMGLKSTHFDTPSGLDGDTHYTTAYELALITKAAFGYKDFSEVVGCKSAVLETVGGKKIYLTNHNRLLKLYDDVIGVKTGFTKKSGRCLVSASKKDGKFVIAVTLNDGNDWADHRELLNIGLSAIENKTVKPKIKDISVCGGTASKTAAETEEFNIGLSAGEKLVCRVDVPDTLFAPIKKGEKVGTAEYFVDGVLVEECDVVATDTVKSKKSSFFELIIYNFLNILSKI